jgi:hypothetical protein
MLDGAGELDPGPLAVAKQIWRGSFMPSAMRH